MNMPPSQILAFLDLRSIRSFMDQKPKWLSSIKF